MPILDSIPCHGSDSIIVPTIDAVAAGSLGYVAQVLATCFGETNIPILASIGGADDPLSELWLRSMQKRNIDVQDVRRRQGEKIGIERGIPTEDRRTIFCHSLWGK